MGVQPHCNSLPREREDCGLLPRRSWIAPGDPVRHVAGSMSPSVSPAPLPGPGVGLATPLAAPARGWDQMYLLADAKPKEGNAREYSRPKTVF